MSKKIITNFNFHLFLFLIFGFFACQPKAKTENKNKETVDHNLNPQIGLVEDAKEAVEAVHGVEAPADAADAIQDENKPIQIPTEFNSDIRPNQIILLNQIYTDTIEFKTYYNEGDYFTLGGIKHGKEVLMISSWDWEDKKSNFEYGDKLKIQWKMERFVNAGDEEIIDFREKAIEAEKIVSQNNSQQSERIIDPNNPDSFVPEGYKIFEKKFGNFNKDEQEDCILIIKATDKNNIVINRFEEKVDRNRRGIIVLFKTENGYQLADKNYDCFLSENEDGGVYFPPELWVGEERGNLVIHYGHGRYGFWKYKFRFQDSSFKLIGYDASSNHGPVILEETSINFLTQKKLIRNNINQNSDSGGEEIFKETWTEFELEQLPELSGIESFEDLEMHKF